MFETVGSLAFFKIIVDYLRDQIDAFTSSQLSAMISAIGTFAITLMSIWFVMEGFAIMSGRSRDPIMGLVMKVGRAALILSAATGLHMGTSEIISKVNGLRNDITTLVTGSPTDVYTMVDDNLRNTDTILSGINSLQSFLEANSTGNNSASSLTTALLASGIGGASPAMVGGTFSLLNQIALSLAIVFGPICILSLLFESTKSIFWGWIQYVIGVMCTMGVLAVVTGWALDITEKYAEAIIALDIGNALLNEFFQGSGGYTSMTQSAMMQGGIGLLMTTLIITVPPMTMTFFRSSLGASFSGTQAFNQLLGGNGNKTSTKDNVITDPKQDPTQSSAMSNRSGPTSHTGVYNAVNRVNDTILKTNPGQRGNASAKVQEV